jgi:hypothetical protein
MKLFNYDFDILNVNVLIVVCIFIVLCGILLFVICSYLIIKFLRLSIDDNSIFFYKYNKKTKIMLDTYGDCKIHKIYLCREPFNKIIHFIINIVTLYNYEKIISLSPECYPYHSSFVMQLKTADGYKFILLDKNNCINITTDFNINNMQEYKQIHVKQCHTLNSILTHTLERIGNSTFFNWNIYKNNCLDFSREILTTIHKLNKTNKQFISCDKILEPLNPSEFTLHMVNCLNVIFNIIQKYIYDNNIFY